LTRLSQSRYANGFFGTNNICSGDLFRAGGLIQFLALFRKRNPRSLLAGRLILSEAQSDAFLSREMLHLFQDPITLQLWNSDGRRTRQNPQWRNTRARESINLFLSPSNAESTERHERNYAQTVVHSSRIIDRRNPACLRSILGFDLPMRVQLNPLLLRLLVLLIELFYPVCLFLQTGYRPVYMIFSYSSLDPGHLMLMNLVDVTDVFVENFTLQSVASDAS